MEQWEKNIEVFTKITNMYKVAIICIHFHANTQTIILFYLNTMHDIQDWWYH